MVARYVWLAAAFVAITVAVIAARPVSTPGPIARDFEAYWAAGSAWNAHADPYGRAIWSAQREVPGVDRRRDELLPFIGPPATLPWWALFAHLPFTTAAVLWLMLVVLSAITLVVCVAIGSNGRADPASLMGLALLAVAFGPLTSDVALGQIALVALTGATFAVVAAQRPAFTGLGTIVAFAQPNVALGLVSQLGRNRMTITIAGAALVTYAIGALAASWSWPAVYLRAVVAHAAAERFVAIQLTPASIGYGFGLPPPVALSLGIFVALLACIAAVMIAIRIRDCFARFAAFSALIPFVAGFAHEHDLVVAYVAAGWCALRTRTVTRMVALAGTLLVAVDWLGLAQRPTGIVQSALLLAGAFCAYSALNERVDARPTIGVAIAVAIIFAGASALAFLHPLPVWPDALGAFHAPADATAAAVWAAEQRAVGLLQTVPAWSILRTLSLLGCALLAAAIYRHSAYRQTASTHPGSTR